MKVRYTEVRKGKNPEAKGRWDNFKLKAGKKQAKLRLGICSNKTPCGFTWELGGGHSKRTKSKRAKRGEKKKTIDSIRLFSF